jgi:hypothetical protein
MITFRRDDESPLEYREREEHAEMEAEWYFMEATKLQAARFNTLMEVARACKSTPNWDSFRNVARHEFYQNTRAAAALYDRTFAEIMQTGEVSEATSKLWDPEASDDEVIF